MRTNTIFSSSTFSPECQTEPQMAFQISEFYRTTRYARKVFVITLGYLGDTLHLLPALWELRRNYPSAELHVATATIGGELLALVPCVDRSWPLLRTPRGTPWPIQWQWIQAVRRERFDVAFNFSGVDRTVFLTFLSGAKWRVSFSGGRHHFWNCWLIPYWVPRIDRTVHVSEQHRGVLRACGLDLGPPCYGLTIPSSATEWARAHVADGALHFSINASNSLKEWPLSHWIDLAKFILRENPGISLVASGTAHVREKERLRQFANALGDCRVKVFAGDLSLTQLIALLLRCRLHVGADSGTLHLATVLNVPTVSLFRDYVGLNEWLPSGEAHSQIVVPCRCVNQKVRPCLRAGRAECLAGVKVENVAQLVAQRMGRWRGG
jgi:ADP-heptose:LPS heptosyltransferase